MNLRHYLSCFGPQFIRGIGVLVEDAHGTPQTFVKSLQPLPDFFVLAKRPQPTSPLAHNVKTVVWGAIAVAWIAMATALFVIQLPLLLWLMLAIVVSLIAPHSLLAVAYLSLILLARK